MFCTSLRRRGSFASIIPALSGPPLSLKESRLETHDAEIPFNSSSRPDVDRPQSNRCLRVLLISPAGVAEAKQKVTLQRIRHFAALTGGENLAIVLLLNTSLDSTLDSAKAATMSSNDTENSSRGVYALTQLQVQMVNHPEIPHIPVLPLCKPEAVRGLLQKYMSHLPHPLQPQPPLLTPLELLQKCTANPSMELQTAYVLSDLFPNLKELSAACSGVPSIPNSNTPSDCGPVSSSQSVAGNNLDPGMGASDSSRLNDRKLQMLRSIIGDREYQGIVDFWKDEWTIE